MNTDNRAETYLLMHKEERLTVLHTGLLEVDNNLPCGFDAR